MNSSTLVGRKVYDPLLRLLHAWNGSAVLGLLTTALIAESMERGPLRESVWGSHIAFGYALAGGLLVRLLWGLIGPRSARLSDLWHPATWLALLRERRRPAPRYGHDPLASAAFIAFYGLAATMAVTGFAVAAIQFEVGPLAAVLGGMRGLKKLFKEPHEILAWAVGGFVVLHAAALVWHAKIEKLPVARSMLDGIQYRRG